MRYLLAIPVYNEVTTLSAILETVRPHAPDILIIDDGSTDGTSNLVAEAADVHTLVHRVNRGYGQSLIDAFRWAGQHGYEWIITMDCDGQHDPRQIADFVRAADRNRADIISGSRYLTPMEGNTAAPADRRALNQRITGLLNELLGLSITDAFCGFKAYRVSALEALRLTVPGYGMPLQLWVQAVMAGLRIQEIPVRLIYTDPDRSFGGSMDDPDTRLLYYYEVLLYELASSLSMRTAPGCPGLRVGVHDAEPQS